jgi:RimJ/RimL family protein N-acetyltransferase
MKVISKFGITFKRLDLEQLELVRQWRNSDDVRLFMQYQEMISPDEQLQWFNNVNNSENYYFIAYKDEEPFGVYNVKNILSQFKSAEVGVYLINKRYWELDWSMRGTFLLMDFVFHGLKLNSVIAHVLKSNKKTYYYNRQLGFHEDVLLSNEKSYFLILKKEDFYSMKNMKLIEYLKK